MSNNKYEYTQLYVSYRDSGTDHTEKLNKFGFDGWEIVSAVKVDEVTIMYLLKRKFTNLIN